MHFYVDCEDIDTRYQRHKDAMKALPQGFVKPSFDTHWGQCEYHAMHAQASLVSTNHSEIRHDQDHKTYFAN